MNETVILLEQEQKKKAREMIQWAKSSIKVPTDKPGWYIVRNTPYGYQLLSGCFLIHEHAVAECKSRREGWTDKPGWSRPELVKVELTVTKEEI